MASIFPRRNKDGSTTWRVMIRRKGMKPFITCFYAEAEAQAFVQENESKYVLNPEVFSYDHLLARRKREFLSEADHPR